MVHVYQKTGSDCMLACIAMAAGKTHEELWNQSHIDYLIENKGSSNDHTKDLLAEAGFVMGKDVWICHIWDNMPSDQVRQLLKGRRAILSVPSLNIQDGWHVVYWNGWQLFDPNHPSQKQIYRWINQLKINSIWIFDETACGQK